MTPEEMPGLLEAIDAQDDPFVRGIFRTLICTGARKGEMKAAGWENVDLKRAELYIPDSKTGASRTIPLSAPAVELLERLPRMEGNPHVFCGRVEGQGLEGINKAWERIREDADLGDVTIHDLRRTAASWIAQAGYSEFVIRSLLGHSTKGVKGVYARMGGAEALRRAVEDYGQRIASTEDGEDAKIVSLATARK